MNMRNRTLRRAVSAAVTAALLSGMCLVGSASAAFQYPGSYWPLHDSWALALEHQNADEILSLAQKTYDLLMPYGLCMDVCENLEPKCMKASWCAEMKGDIAGAIMWLERQRPLTEWLDQNKHSYQDMLLSIDARMEYLKAAMNPAIYALTDQTGTSYPGSGAPVSGTLYGSAVDGTQEGESAVLTYITFRDGCSVEYWLDYYKNNVPKFKDAVTQGGVIELAWNFTPEGTAGAQRVLDPSSDSYIIEGLEALGELNATVLLRLGAEMNVWNECDGQTYIQAFRKIAAQARMYPNLKLVFSPNDIGRRGTDIEDFYPGDQYVDWIGMSTYHNTSYKTYWGQNASYDFDFTGYGDDAYYGVGNYDSDPMVTIKPIMEFAAQHNKPVMISECGFSYLNRDSGEQLIDFSEEQINKFYSYINMVYPQVKAVFYFDYTLDSEKHSYALDGNVRMQRAYTSAIENNGGYLDYGERQGKTWKKLSDADTDVDTLKLAAYASIPGTAPDQATYYVDGKAVYQSSAVPFYYDLDVSALSPGTHTVSAVITSGQFSVHTADYTISVDWPEGIFTDVTQADWFKTWVDKVVDAGLMSGMGNGQFGAKQNLQISQAMVMAYQIHSKANGGAALPQTGGEWFMPYYQYCLNNGIVTAEQFPLDSLKKGATRFDMVTILDKAIPAARMTEVKAVADGEIPDVSESQPCGDAVYRWYRAGIVSGSDEKGSFNGDSGITRAEVAVILCKINNLA